MLSPAARGLGRNAVLRNTSRSLKRQVHFTAVRRADEPAKPSPPIEPENSTSDSNAPVNSQKSGNSSQQTAEASSVPILNNETPEAGQEIPRIPQRQDTIGKDTSQETDGTPRIRRNVRFSDEEFAARRREREQQVKEIPAKFNLPTESIVERNAKYRQQVHDIRKLRSDEAALRGAQIFEEVNARRKVRGEPELTYYQEAGRRGPREMRPSRDGGYTRKPRSDKERSVKSSPRDGKKLPPRRGGGKQQKDERPLAIRLEERMAELRTTKKKHHFPSRFNPSMSVVEGQDEVDFELGDEWADAIADKDTFTIHNRDGTVTPGRKTNRHHDDLPEDAQVYLDISELGGTAGENQFYTPALSKVEELTDQITLLEEQLEGLENPEPGQPEPEFPPEQQETDIHELMKIKEEIESGESRETRGISKLKREINKLEKERHNFLKENTNSGGWLNLVPLPVAHKPETKDVDDYVPPTFTHRDFKWGIPALPYGAEGRLEAARNVSFELTEPFVPSDITPERMADFQEMQSDDQWQKSWKDLESILKEFSVDAIDERPIPVFNRRMKVPNPPPSSERPGSVYDVNREVQFEDLYSDTQLAIWKEMHKGSFAPKGPKFPIYESEEGHLSREVDLEEDLARIQAAEVMEQLDAATLKTFRRRNEFEIRDIRRRLGLPIINGTYMPELYYNKTKVNVPSTEDQGMPPHKIEGEQPETEVLQSEIVKDNRVKEPEIEDDTKGRLQFWRDSKTYLALLAARIEQLRNITQSTAERMRRHGTGQLLQPLQPGQQPGSIEVVEETAENGLMAILHSQFLKVHKKLEKLEALVTAFQLGPRGPLDPEYSAAWVEANLHEFEKKEFEMTALKMGYPPNSVTMEPQMTPEHESALAQLTNEWWDAASRIGVGGEYTEFSAIPGEGMPYPMNLSGRYAANAGLDTWQRGFRIWTMAQTFQKMGIDFEDPLAKKDEEQEKKVEGLEDEARGDEIDQMKSSTSEVEDNDADAETTDTATEQVDEPLTPPLVDEVTADYVRIISQLRESMKEIDRDVLSLENDYDAFLERQKANPSSHITPSQSSSQEASP